MSVLLVTYPARADATFDAEYYLTHHMPLVRGKWTQYGLGRARALMPDEADPAYRAVAMLEFPIDGDLEAALASPEAAEVFGDVPRFTNIAPVALRGTAW